MTLIDLQCFLAIPPNDVMVLLIHFIQYIYWTTKSQNIDNMIIIKQKKSLKKF